ncbi:hypothetical protein F8M41_009348 [Gigaspora margarita]|uniref:Uncharacterized protein n=1 Tax=Gigaspora margarita TaxID=4874 RepID=A0A8H4EQH0_GIGMA|nr:hypothetical protein F8M41_009348 [Gigaspora margarita]
METESKNDEEFLEPLQITKKDKKRHKTSSNDGFNDEITPRKKRSGILMALATKSHSEEREAAVNIYIYITDPKTKYLPKAHQIYCSKGSKVSAKEMRMEGEKDEKFLKPLKNNKKDPKTPVTTAPMTKSYLEKREVALQYEPLLEEREATTNI